MKMKESQAKRIAVVIAVLTACFVLASASAQTLQLDGGWSLFGDMHNCLVDEQSIIEYDEQYPDDSWTRTYQLKDSLLTINDAYGLEIRWLNPDMILLLWPADESGREVPAYLWLRKPGSVGTGLCGEWHSYQNAFADFTGDSDNGIVLCEFQQTYLTRHSFEEGTLIIDTPDGEVRLQVLSSASDLIFVQLNDETFVLCQTEDYETLAERSMEQYAQATELLNTGELFEGLSVLQAIKPVPSNYRQIMETYKENYRKYAELVIQSGVENSFWEEPSGYQPIAELFEMAYYCPMTELQLKLSGILKQQISWGLSRSQREEEWFFKGFSGSYGIGMFTRGNLPLYGSGRTDRSYTFIAQKSGSVKGYILFDELPVEELNNSVFKLLQDGEMVNEVVAGQKYMISVDWYSPYESIRYDNLAGRHYYFFTYYDETEQ